MKTMNPVRTKSWETKPAALSFLQSHDSTFIRCIVVTMAYKSTVRISVWHISAPTALLDRRGVLSCSSSVWHLRCDIWAEVLMTSHWSMEEEEQLGSELLSELEGDDRVHFVDLVRAVPEHPREVVGVRRVVELQLLAEPPVLGHGVNLVFVVNNLNEMEQKRCEAVKLFDSDITVRVRQTQTSSSDNSGCNNNQCHCKQLTVSWLPW